MDYTFTKNFINMNPIDKKYFIMEETPKHIVKIVECDKSLLNVVKSLNINNSFHFFIDKNGSITQFFNTKYWSNSISHESNREVISILKHKSDTIYDKDIDNSLERLIKILKDKYDILNII